MKILIIEDEPSLRELMSKELAKENHVVETAATFAEASEKVALYSYDCLFCFGNSGDFVAKRRYFCQHR